VYRVRLRRRCVTVRFRHLAANGLVFIGPAAAVSIFGVLYARSGGPVGVVYVLTTIVMGLTAVSHAQMSRPVPKAGSVFSYATAGIGPSTGFVAGWMVLLDYMLIPSVAFLFTGIAVHSFLPAVPTWVLTGVAIVLATGFNLAGGGPRTYPTPVGSPRASGPEPPLGAFMSRGSKSSGSSVRFASDTAR